MQTKIKECIERIYTLLEGHTWYMQSLSTDCSGETERGYVNLRNIPSFYFIY